MRPPTTPSITALVLLALVVALLLLLAGCSHSGFKAKHSDTQQQPSSAQSGARTAPKKHTQSVPQQKRQSAEQIIPGLNAARMARVFEQQGLGCKQPRGSTTTLYNCTSEGNPNLTLLYVGQVTGSGPKQVRSVAAEVVLSASGADLRLAAQSYFGVVARRMEYQGSDVRKASAFVYKNLSATKAASVTIGAAKWTLLSNAEAKVLEVSPAE
jgi:hypothetical protein